MSASEISKKLVASGSELGLWFSIAFELIYSTSFLRYTFIVPPLWPLVDVALWYK